MKLTKLTNLLVIGLVLTFAATGCRKKPVGVTNLPGYGKTGPQDVGTGSPIATGEKPGEGLTTGVPEVDPSQYAKYDRNSDIFKANTVHFDYDSSVVKSGEQANVTAVADHLKANATHAVEIQGHCDERGTEEYNRSLGVRRAEALREELIKDGVDAKRVVTISFGKDKPVDPGHDESAWRKNRRGEFILLTPPK